MIDVTMHGAEFGHHGVAGFLLHLALLGVLESTYDLYQTISVPICHRIRCIHRHICLLLDAKKYKINTFDDCNRCDNVKNAKSFDNRQGK